MKKNKPKFRLRDGIIFIGCLPTPENKKQHTSDGKYIQLAPSTCPIPGTDRQMLLRIPCPRTHHFGWIFAFTLKHQIVFLFISVSDSALCGWERRSIDFNDVDGDPWISMDRFGYP
jgi:hypothetical protein